MHIPLDKNSKSLRIDQVQYAFKSVEKINGVLDKLIYHISILKVWINCLNIYKKLKQSIYTPEIYRHERALIELAEEVFLLSIKGSGSILSQTEREILNTSFKIYMQEMNRIYKNSYLDNKFYTKLTQKLIIIDFSY